MNSMTPEGSQGKSSVQFSEEELRSLQEGINELQKRIPFGFAQTEAGSNLMEALQRAHDSLDAFGTISRRNLNNPLDTTTF